MIDHRFSISGFFRWNRINETELPEVFSGFASAGTRFLAVDAETVTTFTKQKERMPRLCRMAAEAGLEYRDAHAPWGAGFDLNELTDKSRTAIHENLMQILAENHVVTYTVHIGAACIYNRHWNGQEEHFRDVARKALERLVKCAEQNRITLAVENCFEPSTTAQEAMNLVKQIPSPYLGLCLDCGHANLMEPRNRDVSAMACFIQDAWRPGIPHFTPGIPEFMKPEIVTVHIHDNDGLDDRHVLPDSHGTIDWNRYAAVIKNAPRLISLQSEVDLWQGSDLNIGQVVGTLQSKMVITGEQTK